MLLIWDALKRTAALVGTEIAFFMASGSVLEIEAWKTGVQAAIAATLTVWSAIGKSYYSDGKLTKAEVDNAFNQER